jgi:formate dehydrogenase iron-sulfur subunit
VVAFDDTVDMARMARFALEFCAIESCGKCRAASDRPAGSSSWTWFLGTEREKNLALLTELCDIMVNGSLCGLERPDAVPGQSALKNTSGRIS